MLYAAKCYWPGVSQSELEQVATRTLTASPQPAHSDVVYRGSLLFKDDDLVRCLFEGPTRIAFKRASEQAGIPCERVMQSVWLGPEPEPRHPRGLRPRRNSDQPLRKKGDRMSWNRARSLAGPPGVARRSGLWRQRARESEKGLRRYILATLIMTGALAVAAPVASAQTALNATYRAQVAAQTTPFGQVVGPNAHAVTCPDGAYACGSGTDASLGRFSWAAIPNHDGQTASLTFATGTLVIDETLQDASSPGNSFFQTPHSSGNPFNALFSWNVDPASSGSFKGASGSGTDDDHVAGFQLDGTITGLISLP
jgi:hypothetical protein